MLEDWFNHEWSSTFSTRARTNAGTTTGRFVVGYAVCWARQLPASPQGGGKVNGGGWEDIRGLQTTVPQSAISDILERPGSVGQDGQLPSLLSTRPTSSVSCGTADIILFIGCNIRKPLWWWLWWWPSQWLPDVTVYFPACCPGNTKETWNEQGSDKQRWVAVVLWVACQRGCLLNHRLDHLAWQQRAADEEEAHLRHHCWHESLSVFM